MIVIRGGDVLGPDGVRRADVLIEDDHIVDVGEVPARPGAVEVDASEAVVGPGFVDLHVHLRDPGQTWKEDIESGSRSAIAGGYTAVVAMPNTEPAIDGPKVAVEVMASARRVGLVTVEVAGALTKGRLGVEPSELIGLYEAGVRMFSDDGDSVGDAAVLEEVMRTLAGFPGAFVSEHAEDRTLTMTGLMHEGEVSARLGLPGLPSRAEDEIVARDIGLSRRTGCRLHLQHLSTAAAVGLVRDAKRAGARLSAEVTPHHLALDESAVEGLDPNLKMYPPLRSAVDRTALVAGLRDGTIDAVATDHAPHTPDEKAVGFTDAPRGVIGLESSAPIVFGALGGNLDRFFERMSIAPARILGLERHGRPVRRGGPANVVVWRPDESWVLSRFRSKSSNSPFNGWRLTGRVAATIHEGSLVHEVGADV